MKTLVDGRPGKVVFIEDLVKACGVEDVRIIDPYNLGEMIQALKEGDKVNRAGDGGISVIIARHPCLMNHDALKGQRAYTVEITDDCTACKICHRDFECPAIEPDPESGRARIDRNLCSGCGVCVDVCPKGAIKKHGA
jgi:indolepyruvate ferredoxin oxidoreductase alpha subunit